MKVRITVSYHFSLLNEDRRKFVTYFWVFIDTCLEVSLFNFIFFSNLLVFVMFLARWFSFFGDFYWLYCKAIDNLSRISWWVCVIMSEIVILR